MQKRLVIVFVKNILLGKVKTRLAVSIGDWGAFEVYKHLVDQTEAVTNQLENTDVRIYFSDQVIDSKWQGCEKFVQEGDDLGERMLKAFVQGFEDGYESIIGIGSDLPDLNKEIIEEGFQLLEQSDLVFGPAADGGYYLLGMNKLHLSVFKNKPWSKEELLQTTLNELKDGQLAISLLQELNDIDTLEDLRNSVIASQFKHLYDVSGRHQ